MILGSTRASRVVCGVSPQIVRWKRSRNHPAGNSPFIPIVRRGAERCTRGRARSPDLSVLLTIALSFFTSISGFAAEVTPPKPDRYFNDYAHVVSPGADQRFNEQLAQFERDTSDQVVVAVFPTMQSDSDIADYTQRVAQSWGVGQKDRRNGA